AERAEEECAATREARRYLLCVLCGEPLLAEDGSPQARRLPQGPWHGCVSVCRPRLAGLGCTPTKRAQPNGEPSDARPGQGNEPWRSCHDAALSDHWVP